MQGTMAFATMNDIHQYGRSLLQQKQNKEALEVFKKNYANHPNEFTTTLGMARGYSANGDYKNALKYAQMALPMATEDNSKNTVRTMIEKLKEGKDGN
jgi:tetratricopeptide (TPR) repeat protein